MLKKITQLLLVFSFLFAQSTLALAFDNKTVCSAAKDACKGKLVNQGGNKDFTTKSADDLCNYTRAENVITRNYVHATVYVTCLSDKDSTPATASTPAKKGACGDANFQSRSSSTKGLQCSGKTCHNDHNWGTCQF